jgi:tetratricopeptide (TPR) repeat protein
MKKIYRILFFYLLLMLFPLCAEMQQPSDISLYQELSAAYGGGFYPGVVSYAEQLVSLYPDSVFSGRSSAMEGEALVRLGRFDDAVPVLEHAEKLAGSASQSAAECVYWRARAEYGRGNNSKASYLFHVFFTGAGKNNRYYASAVLYSGRTCMLLGDYRPAALLFQYVISSGTSYTPAEYSEAAVKLFDAYNKIQEYRKTIAVFAQFRQSDFSAYMYYMLAEYAGEAYESLGEYKKAYDLYSNVLDSGQKNLAVGALRKAYRVSSEHRSEVGEDSGKVLADAQNTLADSPELVSEFWTRLAIDAYSAGTYEKAVDYFDKAENNATPGLLQIAALYRAEMMVNGKNVPVENAVSILKKTADKTLLLPDSDNGRSYQVAMVRYAAMLKNWDDVLKYASGIQSPDKETSYYKAYALYNTGKYDTAIAVLEPYTDPNTNNPPPVMALYALVLARTSRFSDAIAIYGKMSDADTIDNVSRLDYAELLLQTGKNDEAYVQASKSKQPLASYIAGLAQFNNKNWASAVAGFAHCLDTDILPDTGQYRAFALFYKGYAEYRQGNTKTAYADLVKFAGAYPDNHLVFEACMTAANAAVQNGDYINAATQAEAAVKIASSGKGHENAVLLCSGIYSDAKQYDKAVDILSDPSREINPFGMKCLYQIAQIYVRQGKNDTADSTYASLAQKYPSDPLAEESLYRRGELFYTLQKYETAINRFSAYTTAYPGGRFTDAAWYFTAESCALTGALDRAILTDMMLIKQYPVSTYVYSAEKSLLKWSRDRGDYADALAAARSLLSLYGGQAKKDGIAQEEAELEKLASGADKRIVEKQSDYEQAGKNETAAGRKIGTELAELYMASSRYDLAESLAVPLLEQQKKNISLESQYAARTADVLAACNHWKKSYKQAAGMFLVAAEYYRMNSNADKAAVSLYRAADSFMSAKMEGDAQDTAKTLKSLYPDSLLSKTVDSLIGK